MPKLSVYKSRRHLFNYYVDGNEIIIGRSRDADVPLDSEAVSRRHARISRHGSTWVAEDLSHKNGMFVNGRYTHMHFLKDGDHIEIAQHLLVFHRSHTEAEQEKLKRDGRGDYLMSVSALERLLEEEEPSVDDYCERIDTLQATALMSAIDLQHIQRHNAVRRGAHLAWIDGGCRHEVPLTGTKVFRIGWNESCDLRLPGKGVVGELAAQISPTSDGGYELRVHSPWPAIKIGGRRVHSHRFRGDEVIQVSGLKLRFHAAME